MSFFRGINREAVERLGLNMIELPPGVGPHDGKELSLMLAGRKPLAMFYDTVPEIGVIPRHEFQSYVTVGRIVSREVTFLPTATGGVPVRFVFYGQPWAPEGMAKLQEIHRRIHDGSLAGSDDVDTQVGRLLGYTDHDIGVYLAWRYQVLSQILK